MRRFKVPVTTAADGSATVYSPRLAGKIHQIEYVKAQSGGFDDGVDFAITGEATGVGLWAQSNVNASAIVSPRQPTHNQVGVAATLDGTRPALDKVALANDRVKIVVAQGGNAKTGAFHFLLDN